MREKIIQLTEEKKIIAIIRGMEESRILPLAEALLKGGISLMEITFNLAKLDSFAGTLRGIEAVNKKFEGSAFCGAGTVISPDLAEKAAGAGAFFIVSPDANPVVIKKTRDLGLVSMPGALTATECLAAHNAGADFVKLFPAADLGPAYLKALRAPLSHIRFLAVGGINEQNAADFIKAGAAGLGIGGNLVNKDWIAAGDWEKISALARKTAEAVT